jgi:hypothetical protein
MFDGVFDKDSIVILGSNANQFATLLESPSALHLLFRIVDDFLLISTDLETSRRFLKRINRGEFLACFCVFLIATDYSAFAFMRL